MEIWTALHDTVQNMPPRFSPALPVPNERYVTMTLTQRLIRRVEILLTGVRD
jgi:hypothetical protein